MRYVWDPAKAAANFAKHGVPFETVAGFEWDRADIKEDRRQDYGEVRFTAVAPLNGRLHVLVFTWRNDEVRIIGLRKANEREKVRYERQTQAG